MNIPLSAQTSAAQSLKPGKPGAGRSDPGVMGILRGKTLETAGKSGPTGPERTTSGDSPRAPTGAAGSDREGADRADAGRWTDGGAIAPVAGPEGAPFASGDFSQTLEKLDADLRGAAAERESAGIIGTDTARNAGIPGDAAVSAAAPTQPDLAVATQPSKRDAEPALPAPMTAALQKSAPATDLIREAGSLASAAGTAASDRQSGSPDPSLAGSLLRGGQSDPSGRAQPNAVLPGAGPISVMVADAAPQPARPVNMGAGAAAWGREGAGWTAETVTPLQDHVGNVRGGIERARTGTAEGSAIPAIGLKDAGAASASGNAASQISWPGQTPGPEPAARGAQAGLAEVPPPATSASVQVSPAVQRRGSAIQPSPETRAPDQIAPPALPVTPGAGSGLSSTVRGALRDVSGTAESRELSPRMSGPRSIADASPQSGTAARYEARREDPDRRASDPVTLAGNVRAIGSPAVSGAEPASPVSLPAGDGGRTSTALPVMIVESGASGASSSGTPFATGTASFGAVSPGSAFSSTVSQLGMPMPADAARTMAPQIAAALSVQQGPGRVELQLDPPELGRIEIAFEIADHGLRASIVAERASTGEMIRRHGELLLQHLQDAGFSDIDLRFGEGQRDPRHGGDAANGKPSLGRQPSEPTAVEPVAQAAGTASDRLDLRF